MSHDQHAAPPPPYSETDIYSAPSQPAASVAAHSTSDDVHSNQSEVVYTPPLTPSSNNLPAALADYFQSRPCPTGIPSTGIKSDIRFHPEAVPEEFPYQSDWSSHDVNAQDWATFLNYLLPGHALRGNQNVLDRKIQAEAEAEAVTGGGHDGAAASVSGRSQAESQRDQLGSEKDSSHEHANFTDPHVTLQQWNEHFFRPRGMTVRIDEESYNQMPGTWDESFDEGAYQEDEAGPSTRSLGGGGGRGGGGRGWRGRGGRGGGWHRNFGGVEMGGRGVRYGQGFVADSNGVKLGPFVMDGSGFRMGAHPNDYPGRGGPNDHGGHQYWHQQAGWGPGRDRGRWPGAEQGGYYPGGGPSHEPHGGQHPHHHHHEGERRQRRDSTSSLSSLSSESSIGSLPDYDDVKEQSLPLYVRRLNEWNTQPAHKRTRADVKGLKAELKEAKKLPVDPSMDVKALRQQAKSLAAQWKMVRKQQRSQARELKRDRKANRRADKRERRADRRERRQEKRDIRRGKIPENPPAPYGVSQPSMPSQPHAPYGGYGGVSRGRHSMNLPIVGGLFNSITQQARQRFGDRPFGGGEPAYNRGPPGAYPGGGEPSYQPHDPPSGGPRGVPDKNSASYGMYKAVVKLEAKIEDKEEKLSQMKEGDSSRKGKEKEIEALGEELQNLKLQADLAYEQEQKSAGHH